MADSGIVPDPFDIFVKPIYDIYELKNPLIDRVIDFTDYNKVKRCLLGSIVYKIDRWNLISFLIYQLVHKINSRLY